LFGYSITLHTR